jgi:SnoaL-like domain
LPRVAPGRSLGAVKRKEVQMADVEATIERWFTALNEPEGSRRAPLVEQTWAVDGRWVDPPFEGEGHSGINEMVETVYQHYPNHRFRRSSGIDTHHDSVRVAWELVSPDGDVVLAGTDVGLLDGDGRLSRVTGFFGPLPA